jgi:hypothetical protein
MAASRGGQSFQKRQKELSRKTKQEEKRAKRMERKLHKDASETPQELAPLPDAAADSAAGE